MNKAMKYNASLTNSLSAAPNHLTEYGRNELTPPRHNLRWLRLLESVFGGCFVAYGIVQSNIAMPLKCLGVVFVVVLALTGISGYYQESPSADSMSSLPKTRPKNDIKRDDKKSEVQPRDSLSSDIAALIQFVWHELEYGQNNKWLDYFDNSKLRSVDPIAYQLYTKPSYSSIGQSPAWLKAKTVDLRNSIQINGEIKCKIKMVIHTVIFEWIEVKYNVYTQIINATQLKMRYYEAISNVSILKQQKNKSLFALNTKSNKEETTTQWIEITLKCDEKLKYTFGARAVITNISSSKLKKYDEYKLHGITLKEINFHHIREYVFSQSLMELYNLFCPNDVLSIIFDQYYPHYFDTYGEPFIYDQLELHHNIDSLLNKIDYNHDNEIKQVFLMNNEQELICNINGIAIQLSIDKDWIFDHHFLNQYDIDSATLCGIWSFENSSTLRRIKELKRHLLETEGNPTLNAKLLLDTKILDNEDFMLWIKWGGNRNTGSYNSWNGFYTSTRNQSLINCADYWTTSDWIAKLEEEQRKTQLHNSFREATKQNKERVRQSFRDPSNKYNNYKYRAKHKYHRW